MSYPVRADADQAIMLARMRGLEEAVIDDREALASAIRGIVISEKGYPFDTEVEINGSNPMAMALAVEKDGTWELV